MVEDAHSKIIQQEVDHHHLASMKINCNYPVLSHIFFADDALLFLKAELSECQNIKRILDDYDYASGRLINYDKSGAFFSSDLCGTDMQLCSDFLDVDLMKGDSKYLRVPYF